jgi:hypothetical protein
MFISCLEQEVNCVHFLSGTGSEYYSFSIFSCLLVYGFQTMYGWQIITADERGYLQSLGSFVQLTENDGLQ